MAPSGRVRPGVEVRGRGRPGVEKRGRVRLDNTEVMNLPIPRNEPGKYEWLWFYMFGMGDHVLV